MSEDQAEYVTEAMKLLHGEPAAIIEQPRERLVLRSGLESEQTAAWVKLSTAFKPHIKELRGAPLAVWLYISLCINKGGVAFPSISNIAEETGYSRQGIIDAINTLEGKGYLKVRRGEKKYNLYEPEFAAIGRGNEPIGSVNLVDSSDAIGQVLPPDRSTFSADRSTPLDLNKRNKRELEKDAAAPLSQKDLSDIQEQADKTVDGFLENERKIQEREAVGQAWRGRELLPPEYLIYGDWWHQKTQLHMYGSKGKAKVNTEWLKAFKEWWENDVTANTLEQVYEAEKSWKGVIGKPSELTTKAVALQALPPEKETEAVDQNNPESYNQHVLQKIMQKLKPQGVNYGQAFSD